MKEDKELMQLLKVDYIAKPLVNTSKGLLAIVLRNNENKYHITLDAVPLEDELQTQILKLYENIQSKEVGDAPRAQEDYPRIEESGIKKRSVKTSKRAQEY